MASAVVAHDGGVRLKCAGWVPHDDDSDANGTAVYRRASLTITVRIALWLIGSLQVCSLTAPTSGHLGQPSLSAGWLLHGRQRPAPAGEFAGDGDVGDQWVLAAFGEAAPPLVEAPVAGVPASPKRRVDLGPAGPQGGSRQEPLRVPHRGEAFHRPLTLPGRLVRVLSSIVQILRSAMLHRRHELAVRDPIAAQPVGDDDPRHVLQALEEFAEELLGGHRVSAWWTRMSSTLPCWSTARHR